MKQFPISSRNNENYLNQTRMSPPPGSPPAPVHGINNIFLGGLMLLGIIVALVSLCYCCHKTNRKSSPNLSSMIWRDPGLSLQIYTVEAAAQNRLVEMEDSAERELSRCPTPAPPPPYDSVIVENKRTQAKSSDSSGLPSYEAAVRSLHTPTTTLHWTTHDYV